jgi:selenocysteine lyase/cysteine desulfurase
VGEDFARPIEDARRACAALIGADPSEIALGTNTSFGINVAALGLDVPVGAAVLVPDREFPANVYPWMLNERLRLETVPPTPEGFPDEDRLLERLRDPDVAIVSVSSVQFSNGYAIDLERLGLACREAGVFFVVDAIQSLGQMPLDVSRVPVDIVATGGHKWLCGPFGAGFVYVRREVQDRLRPVSIGWQSLQAAQRLESLLDYAPHLVSDARRYEQGTPPFQDLAALAASLEMIREAGVESIRRYLLELLTPLRRWLEDAPEVRVLSPKSGAGASAIVSFIPPSVDAVHRAVRDAGVVCSLREGAIRVAPHFYNRPEEIARLLEVLESSRRKGWG